MERKSEMQGGRGIKISGPGPRAVAHTCIFSALLGTAWKKVFLHMMEGLLDAGRQATERLRKNVMDAVSYIFVIGTLGAGLW
jgi:hypothetical protein